MIKFENDCCDCALHCRGSTCRNRNAPHFYCDECEDEVEELFEYDGEQICQDCLISTVPKIKLEDYIESDC